MLGLDQYLFRLGYSAGGEHLLPLMIFFTVVGSGWTMFALLPFLAWEQTRRWAFALTLTLLATAVTVFVLKMAVGRIRPIFALADVRPLYGSPTDFSFPSGHAAGSFTVAGFAWVLGREHARLHSATARLTYFGCAVAFAMAAAIAYSRVYLGVHFPGDVLVGGVLGTIVGTLGASGYVSRASRKRNERDELAPDDVADAD